MPPRAARLTHLLRRPALALLLTLLVSISSLGAAGGSTTENSGSHALAQEECTVGCVEIGVTLEEFPGPLSEISEFGRLSGRMPDMVMFFQAWGEADGAFKDWLPDLEAMGVDPLITWEPWDREAFLSQSTYTLQSIVAGQHDAYIDDWARRSAEYGDTIYLRFAHEMNTPPGAPSWYPWQGDPETYIAAWRHVHDRFEAAGADNVQWVWSVAWMNQDAPLYYPGDEYVDWVALTVLNFGTTVAEPGWKSFAELYSAQHERAASFGKPVMISELATAEQGGDKGQWMADIAPAIQNQYPEIQAIVWNNYSFARHVPDANWAVDSSPGALAGWRRLMANPFVTDPAEKMRLTWARTDRPIAWGVTSRTWIWGPEPFTDVRVEDYVDAPGGTRLVRYYDKSRMEITDPNRDWTSPWYVTNGLLVTEMITGRVQRGDNTFEQWNPAPVNVAGDATDPNGPTYASFNAVLDAPPLALGALVTQRIDRAGNVSDDPALAERGVAATFLDDVTNHTIAEPFWAFMNSGGTVWDYGMFVDDLLFENPFFATGRPITNPYWATVLLAGEPTDVLIQCFERRCLTYTPNNPPAWQVEAGNVGRHYFTWRFGE